MCYSKDAITLMMEYDCQTGQLSCLSGLEGLSGSQYAWQAISQQRIDTAALWNQIRDAASSARPYAQFISLVIGTKAYRAGVFCTAPGTSVTIVLTDFEESGTENNQRDPLTGLISRDAFCNAVEQQIHADPMSAAQGGYSLIYIDFLRFKVINDLFGRAKGDALLIHIADTLRDLLRTPSVACRLMSDHFAVFLPSKNNAPEELLKALVSSMQATDFPFEITFHAGIYQTCSEQLPADTMIDRAVMALSSIKGSYNVRHAYYTADMRKALLSEQEITGMMGTALSEKQFVIHFQPQYSHSTGMLVGAEALVRWQHPERGLVLPADFLPIFEQNGSITNLDLYVFEQVCIFLRKSMDNHWAIVPVSVNFSQRDIFLPDLVQRLEAIRSKYQVPSKYLRIELTESVMVGGPEFINEIIQKLHQHGYVVEMDDFGSGYSSLNVLKDMDLDIIKLDMRFLSENPKNNKGGTILSSMVRMAKWLDLPVIAEGVETVEQADFLRSIGCDYIQGYLYSKPLPEDAYICLVCSNRIGATVPQLRLIDTMNALDFWDPKSQETLIFSNYVGAAALFDYCDEKLELLRINKKYLQELGMNLSEKELIDSDPLAVMDDENKEIYLKMLQKAIDSMDEQECETWWNISSSCCGEERFCIRSNVRVIGVSGDRYLFYVMIRNVTAERLYYDAILDSERRFKMASEQVNIYYWEYTVATREMRPCFRCMRDLGLPALLTNYPEPVIESGLFPAEIADMYRDWHRQVAAGVPALEAIIPLTSDRVPFRVRYTTEFDENGHPVKAYGSAALIVA